jgi:hypothetical protein
MPTSMLARTQTTPDPYSTDELARPVRLTDAQASAVFAAAHPLASDRRSDFLTDVARALSRLPMVGDGAVHRVVIDVQRKYFDPPIETAAHHGGKYSRR